MTSVVDAVICIFIKLSQNCAMNDDDDGGRLGGLD